MQKIILLLLLTCLSGCVLVPFIDSFEKSGFREKDRKTLLDKTVNAFYKKVIAGDFSDLGEYLDPEYADELIDALRANRRNEKIIEGKIDFISYNEDVKEARVDMLVSFFETPYYIVNERIEKQNWVFLGVSSQWRMRAREITQVNPK